MHRPIHFIKLLILFSLVTIISIFMIAISLSILAFGLIITLIALTLHWFRTKFRRQKTPPTIQIDEDGHLIIEHDKLP